MAADRGVRVQAAARTLSEARARHAELMAAAEDPLRTSDEARQAVYSSAYTVAACEAALEEAKRGG